MSRSKDTGSRAAGPRSCALRSAPIDAAATKPGATRRNIDAPSVFDRGIVAEPARTRATIPAIRRGGGDMPSRREFLFGLGLAAAPFARRALAASTFKLSVITDEISQDFAHA